MRAMFDNFSTWLTLIMLIIFTSMVLISFGYPAGARFMPLVVGIPGILLCLLQLVLDWFATHRSGVDKYFHSAPRAGVHDLDEFPVADHEEVVEAEEEEEFGPHTVKDEIKIWVYFLVFMAGVILLGFIVAVPVMVAVYLKREAKVGLLWALASAAACTLAMYLMFERLLTFQLHPGILAAGLWKAIGL